MSGPDAEARELTEREARRALREQFYLPPYFEDTSPEAERSGVAECPYRKEKPRELYEAGRKMMRAYLLQNAKLCGERSESERTTGYASGGRE